jgi:peroxiredoxin
MRSDIIPGALFPDYALPDQDGKIRKLSDIQGIDPLVLILARGHYCPKDAQQHFDLAAAQSKFNVSYVGLATISTDTVVVSREFRASVGATWPFLSDPRLLVRRTPHARGDLV